MLYSCKGEKLKRGFGFIKKYERVVEDHEGKERSFAYDPPLEYFPEKQTFWIRVVYEAVVLEGPEI